MLSFALGLSINFLVQNTTQSSIQNTEVNSAIFHPQFCPSLIHCLTVHLPQCSCMMKVATSSFETKRFNSSVEWRALPQRCCKSQGSENTMKTPNGKSSSYLVNLVVLYCDLMNQFGKKNFIIPIKKQYCWHVIVYGILSLGFFPPLFFRDFTQSNFLCEFLIETLKQAHG